MKQISLPSFFSRFSPRKTRLLPKLGLLSSLLLVVYLFAVTTPAKASALYFFITNLPPRTPFSVTTYHHLCINPIGSIPPSGIDQSAATATTNSGNLVYLKVWVPDHDIDTWYAYTTLSYYHRNVTTPLPARPFSLPDHTMIFVRVELWETSYQLPHTVPFPSGRILSAQTFNFDCYKGVMLNNWQKVYSPDGVPFP